MLVQDVGGRKGQPAREQSDEQQSEVICSDKECKDCTMRRTMKDVDQA